MRCWSIMMCRDAGLQGRMICEEEDEVMGRKATYWTSSEAGMSGVFSFGPI